jgi:hypothetical protein
MMGGPTLDEGNIAAAFKIDESKIGNAPTGTDGPSYSQMLQSLFEDIRKSVAGDDDKKEAYIRELGIHRKKIGDEIAKNSIELAKLEKEEKSKITSDGLHEGFSTSVSLLIPPPTNDSMLRNRARNHRLLGPVTRLNLSKKLRPWKFLMLKSWNNRIP